MSISKINTASGYDNIQGVAVAKAPGIGRYVRIDTRSQYGTIDGGFNPSGRINIQDSTLSGFQGQFSATPLASGGNTAFSSEINGFSAGSLNIRNQSALGIYVYLNRDIAGTTGYFVPAGAEFSQSDVLINKVNLASSGVAASPVFISALPNIDPSKIL